MKTNTIEKRANSTHGGAVAHNINAEQELRRSVMACMLWEDSFYEEGTAIADRIKAAIIKVKPEKVAEIAIEAREKMKLRHVPLLIVREMARLEKSKALVADTLARIIQRADEMPEFLSLYWQDKKQPLSAQVKKGLAAAFAKFDAYALAKYDRDAKIKLRDVLKLCHAKPKDAAQAVMWKQVLTRTLPTPDTWEVAISGAGKDKGAKKASWERLLTDDKLGGLALLRNLRNFTEAKVDTKLVNAALAKMKTDRVLPFRFITAAKHAPGYETELEQAMFRMLAGHEKLPGRTVLVVDVSGSMFGHGNISRHSELTRVEAACGLAALIREVCEEPFIYATAGDDYAKVHATKRCAARRGFGLIDLIQKGMQQELGGGGIFLTQCLEHIKKEVESADRVIVITDEQDCDNKCNPDKADAFGKHNYLINISVDKHGIGYGKWTHLDGWSESIVEYIRASERQQ